MEFEREAERDQEEPDAEGEDAGGDVELYELELGGDVYVVASFPSVPAGSLEGLTAAERDVAWRVVQGKSNREIAALRGTSVRTVAVQLRSIFEKLGVSSRAELMHHCSNSARGV